MLFLSALAFAVLPVFFMDNPGEFAPLLIPMYGNGYLGIAAWIAAGKPIWQITIAAASVISAYLILFYLGFDLGKILITFFLRKKKVIKPNRTNKFLASKGLTITYLVCLIPGIPFVMPTAVFLTNAENKKYGIWILIAINFIRTYFTVWLEYKGLQLFPLISESLKRYF